MTPFTQVETLISCVQTMLSVAPALCSLACVFFVVLLMCEFGNSAQRFLRFSALVVFVAIGALWISTLFSEGGPDGSWSGAVWKIAAGTVVSCAQVWFTWRLINRRLIEPSPAKNSDNPAPRPDYSPPQLTQKSFEEYFKLRRPYLDPEFRLTDLTGELGVNRSELSAFINRTFETNFPRYVNRWRLAEFERLMSLPSNELKNPYKVATMAGFSNARHFMRVVEQEQENKQLTELQYAT
jgi:AraC-like DNA-binding protein